MNRVRNDPDYAPRLYRACKGWVGEEMRRARIHPNDDKRILDLHHFRVAVGQVAPPARDYKDVVWRAVHNGLYRPQDELFTVTSVNALLDWRSAHAR